MRTLYYDENVGGREFRMAAERFARTAATAEEAVRQPSLGFRTRIDERLETAVRFGWPDYDPELAAWLDRVHAEPAANPGEPRWHELAAGAATRPVGVYHMTSHGVTRCATVDGTIVGGTIGAVAIPR